jgi:hypothetical protein
MKKIDLKRELKNLYSASSKKVGIVNVPKMNFLMIDGEGDPKVIEAKEPLKKKKSLPALSKVYFKEFLEGKVAQIMHIGPFSEEGPTIEKLHNFIKDNGYELHGKHHEIYLSDIRRAAPEKWKTIIRQPIRKKG